MKDAGGVFRYRLCSDFSRHERKFANSRNSCIMANKGGGCYCLAAGMDDHIGKPLDIMVVAAKIKQHMKSGNKS